MELLHKYLLKEWISGWQTEFQHKFLAHDFKYLDILICLNERHRVRHLGYKWEKNWCIACSSRSSSTGMDRHYQPYNQINLRFNSEKCSKVEVAPTERADNGAFELDRVTREWLKWDPKSIPDTGNSMFKCPTAWKSRLRPGKKPASLPQKE